MDLHYRLYSINLLWLILVGYTAFGLASYPAIKRKFTFLACGIQHPIITSATTILDTLAQRLYGGNDVCQILQTKGYLTQVVFKTMACNPWFALVQSAGSS
jgi:hypothetical protein